MRKHKHAELMAQYAEDALETNKPWKRWEGTNSDTPWETLSGTPTWSEQCRYRRKYKTIRERFADWRYENEDAPMTTGLLWEAFQEGASQGARQAKEVSDE